MKHNKKLMVALLVLVAAPVAYAAHVDITQWSSVDAASMTLIGGTMSFNNNGESTCSSTPCTLRAPIDPHGHGFVTGGANPEGEGRLVEVTGYGECVCGEFCSSNNVAVNFITRGLDSGDGRTADGCWLPNSGSGVPVSCSVAISPTLVDDDENYYYVEMYSLSTCWQLSGVVVEYSYEDRI